MPTAPKNYKPFPDAPRPDPRPNSAKRGYGDGWTKTRNWFIAKNPLCARCGVVAKEVDHIVPVRVAPHRLRDESNLQSLCKPCHGRKTEEDKRKYPEDY